MIRKSAVNIFHNIFHNSHDGERSARRGAMKNAALYLIDGEYVDAATLVARLGVDKQRALAKVSRAKKKPGPLTWAKLGVTS